MLFGEVTRFSIRFPAVVCGALAIPVSYFIGKEVKSETLGLLVAALVSFMFPFFYYSQDARAYPLILFAFLGFTYFWLKLYKGSNNLVHIVGISFFAALCIWSHYYSVVPMGVLLACYLWKYKNRAILCILGLTFVFVLPLILMFDFSQFFSRTNHGVFNVLWHSPLTIATMLPNEMFCWSVLIIIPLAIYSLYKHWKNPVLKAFALAGTITPLLMIPMAHFTAVMPRYAVLVSPLIICVAMYPVASTIDGFKGIDKKVAVFVGVVFLVFIFNYGSILSWMTFSICQWMQWQGYTT
jgi:4-amino-4-deoxy-L-arabinose transferase-like glycosyltransferase